MQAYSVCSLTSDVYSFSNVWFSYIIILEMWRDQERLEENVTPRYLW